jgi:hypothetical protein
MEAASSCASCGTPVSGLHCPACGERRLAAEELTLVAQLGQLVGGLFSIDGKLLRSLTALLRPGFLAVEYCRGARVRWMRPVQLFLVANLCYFLLQPLTDFNTFSSTLRLQLERQEYSASLRPVVEARVAELGLSHEEYALRFDATANGLARSLLLLLVPTLALAMSAVGLRGRRTYVEHLVLAAHYVSFQLVFLYCAGFSLVTLAQHLGLFELSEQACGVLTLAILGSWLVPAWQRFHALPWWRATLTASVLVALHMPIVVGYRYLLFWLTLAVT